MREGKGAGVWRYGWGKYYGHVERARLQVQFMVPVYVPSKLKSEVSFWKGRRGRGGEGYHSLWRATREIS